MVEKKARREKETEKSEELRTKEQLESGDG